MKLDEIKPLEAKHESFTLKVDEYTVYFHCETKSSEYRELFEGKQRGDVSLGSLYSANHHQAHVKDSQEHIHLYVKQTELLAMNKDGSGKDGSSGRVLPSKVAKAIKKKFPDFTIPPNRVLESIKPAQALIMKFEQLNG